MHAFANTLPYLIFNKINALDKELKGYQVKIKAAKGSAAAGYKKRALMVLKRKKQYEAQRDSLAAQSFNIGNVGELIVMDMLYLHNVLRISTIYNRLPLLLSLLRIQPRPWQL